MFETLYLIYDQNNNTVYGLYPTHGQAYVALRDYAEPDEVIINDTVRSGVCIKMMSVFAILRTLLVGNQVNL